MVGSWGNVPRQHLMETIVILWTLNEVPGGHKVNEAAQVPAESSGTRQLTFDREKSVVEILAFLSGTSDDPAKVMAVCVEENLAGDGLTVRLASNSGNCGDIVLGFERIAKILEQSSRRGQSLSQHRQIARLIRCARKNEASLPARPPEGDCAARFLEDPVAPQIETRKSISQDSWQTVFDFATLCSCEQPSPSERKEAISRRGSSPQGENPTHIEIGHAA